MTYLKSLIMSDYAMEKFKSLKGEYDFSVQCIFSLKIIFVTSNLREINRNSRLKSLATKNPRAILSSPQYQICVGN